MRIKSLLILILVLVILLLSSCTKQPVETQPTTAPTAGSTTEPTEEPTMTPATEPTNTPTTQSITEPATQPSELPPPTEPSTEPVDENALTQEEIDEFKYMFTQQFNEDPSIPAAINYYNRILWSDFETPAQVNIRWVFYDQDIDENWELTEAERTYLSQFEYVPLHLSVVRVSVEKMNRVLQQHLGISLEETERIGMETMAYYSNTDCYYSGKGDFAVGAIKIYRGRWLEDGMVEIEYKYDMWDKVTILQKTDTGYIVLSNKTV